MSRVSIIIATYNYARYLPDAVHSLQQQTYKDWECIVVDDGSTDNTRDVVSAMMKEEGRIQYKYIANAGPSAARNTGVANASGDFILFLDADDKLEPNKLTSHLKAFDDDPGLDVAYGDVRYFNDGDTNPQHYFYSLNKQKQKWIPRFSGYAQPLSSKVLRENIMVTSSPLFSKEALFKTGLFDSKLKKLEDWELFQRMVINNLKLKFIEEKDSFVLMRAHSTSYSFNKSDMRSYLLPILQKNIASAKVGAFNFTYLCIRMVEEFTDLLFLNIVGKRVAIRLYFKNSLIFLLLISILFMPFYIVIKIFRTLC